MKKESNITNFPDLGSELTFKIIESAIAVHKHFGPGLLENIYAECLAMELTNSGLAVKKQHVMPVTYKDKTLENAYRLDLWVEDKVVVEIKAADRLLPVHEAQILTYMRLTKSPLGLLINFNEKLLKDGIKRFALTDFVKE
jgi:GxxExxY protein